MAIEKLPLTFRKSGYDYNQVLRSENKALYTQSDGKHLIAYEVVKIRRVQDKYVEFWGKTIPAHEQYPGTGEWGLFGWTYKEYDNALKKYNLL